MLLDEVTYISKLIYALNIIVIVATSDAMLKILHRGNFVLPTTIHDAICKICHNKSPK